LLDLAGKPRHPASSSIDVITGSITNWQESGSTQGIGRIDLNIDKPGDELLLAFDRGHLFVGMGADKQVVLDLATSAIARETGQIGAHVYVPPTLRKRPILWAVDTVRAEVGPEPVAVVEAAVFNARDVVPLDVLVPWPAGSGPVASDALEPAPPPKTVDAANSQSDRTVAPPAIKPTWKSRAGRGALDAHPHPTLGSAFFVEARGRPRRQRRTASSGMAPAGSAAPGKATSPAGRRASAVFLPRRPCAPTP
jgi:hypothetical protein